MFPSELTLDSLKQKKRKLPTVEIFCRKDFRSEFLWYGFSLVWLQMYPVVILETT